MSASKRDAGWRHAVRCTSRFIASAARALIAGVKTAVAEYKVVQTQKRRMISLRGLGDHTLRDIGLVRDRFTGTVLNAVSGEVADLEQRQIEATGAARSDTPALSRHVMVERRLAERRAVGQRRIAQRTPVAQQADRAATAHPVQDRRAYDRRASSHRVIDCRNLFSGRARFLPA